MSGIFHRVSIRKYQNKEIEKEKIELILRAAMAAPSAVNRQPWEFYVVTNRDAIKKLSTASQYSTCAKDAPVVFVPCYRSNESEPGYAHIDMSASVENLLLEIDELGLGAVWMGIAPEIDRMEKVREILSIPDSLNAFALVPCGYPAEARQQQDRFDPNRIHYVE